MSEMNELKRKREEEENSVFKFANSQSYSQDDYAPGSQLTQPLIEEEINIPQAAELLLKEINKKNENLYDEQSIKSSYTLNTLSTDHFGDGEKGLFDWAKDIFIVSIEPGDILILKDDIIKFLKYVQKTTITTVQEQMNNFKDLFGLKRKIDLLQKDFEDISTRIKYSDEQNAKQQEEELKTKIYTLLINLKNYINEILENENVNPVDLSIRQNLIEVINLLKMNDSIKIIVEMNDPDLKEKILALNDSINDRNIGKIEQSVKNLLPILNNKLSDLIAIEEAKKSVGGSSKRKTKKHHKKSKRNHKSKKSKSNKKAKRSKRKH